MSYALSNYTSGKQKRKRLKKKMAITDSTGAKTSNVARRITSEKASEVSITVVDAQRENRQASQKWKTKARKIAFGTAIAFHAVVLIIFAVWFVKKTVLQMNEEKIHSIVLDEPKPQTKRERLPRANFRKQRNHALLKCSFLKVML